MTTSGSAIPQPTAAIRGELANLVPRLGWRRLTVYDFTADACPMAMQEIGRLRAGAFRAEGVGRGTNCDLDDFDFGCWPYHQLAAWDPEHQEFVAAIRYQFGARAREGGDAVLRTATLFEYSPVFQDRFLPQAIELGRSFVNRAARRARYGLYAIWRGLANLTQNTPDIAYWFGNVSLFPTLAKDARDVLVGLLERIYARPEPLLVARPGLRFIPPEGSSDDAAAAGSTPRQRIRFLEQKLAERGERLPPILLSYLGLTADLWCGQTAVDADFGDALEVGLVIPVDTITEGTRLRFGWRQSDRTQTPA